MSAGKASTGAGLCENILLKAHRAASASFEPSGTVLSISTNAVAVPFSIRDSIFSGVPFASEPVLSNNKNNSYNNSDKYAINVCLY